MRVTSASRVHTANGMQSIKYLWVFTAQQIDNSLVAPRFVQKWIVFLEAPVQPISKHTGQKKEERKKEKEKKRNISLSHTIVSNLRMPINTI